MDETEQREIEQRLKDKIASYHEAALLFTAVTAGLPELLKAWAGFDWYNAQIKAKRKRAQRD